MNIFSNKTITDIANKRNIRTFVSQMCNHKALLPVIMLEASVISGRTYQAYKRGGITEARERIIDESLTAIVWFGIISWLNAGFGKLIKQKGVFDSKGLPEIAIDLGKDAIRNPIQQAVKLRPEIQNKIGSLKFTKIALSALAGIYLSGLVLPKFYQNLTKKILHKERRNNQTENITNNNKIKMEDFINKTSQKRKLSFGNASTIINTTAHILENNPIAKLLTVDVGLFAGRGYSARNNDERIELLFRDFASSFFYMFSTPLVYKGLSKYIDKFRGKNTNLDPKTAHFVSRNLAKKIGKGMNIQEFKQFALGNNDNLVTQILPKIKTETIDINDFTKIIQGMIFDKKQAENIISNAQQFINLRPKGASKNLLTLSEVINSVRGGKVNDAKFLTRAVKIATNGISQNPKKFISYKEIDKIKLNIIKYTESIIEYAQANGKSSIDSKLLTEIRNRNFLIKLAYTLAGMAVSSLFLSTIIPKLQYKITEWRTGKRDFPGIKDIK